MRCGRALAGVKPLKRKLSMRNIFALLPWLLLLPECTRAAEPAANPFPVSIRMDAAQTKGELKPIWRFFGADEPNYATMKDGKKLLAKLGELKPKQVFFRTH